MAHNQPTKYTQSNYLWNGNETKKFASAFVCVDHTCTRSIRKKRQCDELFTRFWAWSLNFVYFQNGLNTLGYNWTQMKVSDILSASDGSVRCQVPTPKTFPFIRSPYSNPREATVRAKHHFLYSTKLKNNGLIHSRPA